MKLALLSWSLAPLTLALASCELVLDIDRLDRGEDAGQDAGLDAGEDAGGDAGEDAGEDADAAAPGVEVVATAQCNPGRITTADGFVYWTTTKGTVSPCTTTDSIAIRRLGVDSKAKPDNVVTTNLDGHNMDGRPWDLRVVGGKVYWIGSEGAVCSAKADGTAPTCTVPSKIGDTCRSFGLGLAGSSLFFRGDCANGGDIHRYDPSVPATTTTGLSVSGNFTSAIAATPAPTPGAAWVAWVDLVGPTCSTSMTDMNRLNVAWPGKAGWASCTSGTAATHVLDIALDDKRLYWLVDEGGKVSSLHALALSDQLNSSELPKLLVSGLKDARALALDEHNVYFTTADRNGAVLYIPKDATVSRAAADALVLAEGRPDPYSITASPGLPWIYWLEIGAAGVVARAPKPTP